jgi:FkbM family methyltransferase
MKKTTINFLETQATVHVDDENPGLIDKTWMAGNFYECSRNNLLSYLYAAHRDRLKDSIIIDGGANIGNHSLFFAKVLKAKKVFAFEPDAAVFARLKQNIKSNRMGKRIFPYQEALWDSQTDTGRITDSTFHLHPSGNVVATTIDALMEKSRHKVGYIKLDIEGGEIKALFGAIEVLKKDKPIVSVECFDAASYNEVADLLINNYGYKVLKAHGKPIALNATPTYFFY